MLLSIPLLSLRQEYSDISEQIANANLLRHKKKARAAAVVLPIADASSPSDMLPSLCWPKEELSGQARPRLRRPALMTTWAAIGDGDLALPDTEAGAPQDLAAVERRPVSLQRFEGVRAQMGTSRNINQQFRESSKYVALDRGRVPRAVDYHDECCETLCRAITDANVLRMQDCLIKQLGVIVSSLGKPDAVRKRDLLLACECFDADRRLRTAELFVVSVVNFAFHRYRRRVRLIQMVACPEDGPVDIDAPPEHRYSGLRFRYGRRPLVDLLYAPREPFSSNMDMGALETMDDDEWSAFLLTDVALSFGDLHTTQVVVRQLEHGLEAVPREDVYLVTGDAPAVLFKVECDEEVLVDGPREDAGGVVARCGPNFVGRWPSERYVPRRAATRRDGELPAMAPIMAGADVVGE